MDPIPQWSLLQFGDAVDVVSRILVRDDNKILGCTMDFPSKPVIIKGQISNDDFQRDTILVLNAKVVEVQPILTLEVGCNSIIYGMPTCDVKQMQQIVELCSGIGVWSSVAHHVDLHCLAGVDTNPRWESIFHNLHSGAEFLVGDCGDTGMIQKLVEANGFFSTILAGINCQPHSTGGDQRGFQDDRASSLPKVLRAIWLLQSHCAVLECVPAVMTNPEAQAMLQQFCKQTKMSMTQSILQLSDVWCTKRERWFAILSSQVMGPISIPPFPKNDAYGTVKKVMPFVKVWGEDDMEQLKLTLYELSAFNSYAVGGLCNTFLQPDSVMATSLHSTSNQLYPCSCGCRAAFSVQRLQSRGLYGVLIPLGTEIHHDYKVLPECRYPHPVELFVLNGGNPTQEFGPAVRLANAGVGQCVSPIQGIWVLVQVSNAFRRMRAHEVLNPSSVLNDYIETVLAGRNQIWAEPQESSTQYKKIQCQDGQSHAGVEMNIPRNMTVGNFLAIEATFRGDPEILSLGLFVGGDKLDDNDIVADFDCVTFGPVPANCVYEPLPCPCAEWNDMQIDSVEGPRVPLDNSLPVVPSLDRNAPISPTLPFTVCDHSPVSALSQLDSQDFLALIPPKIVSGEDVFRQLNNRISKADRLAVLHKQEDVWADDEIRFAFEVLANSYQHEIPLFAWDPLFMTSLIRFGHLNALESYTSKLPITAYVITAVNVEGHWFPLFWKRHENCLMGLTCGHQFDISVALQALHATVAKFLKCPCLPLQFTRLPFSVNKWCGAMTVHYIAAEIFQRPLITEVSELQCIHENLRRDFCQALGESTPRPWTWGRGEIQPQMMLKALLIEHGVPEAAVEERAQHIINKIGLPTLTSAIQSAVPWKELKWAANRAVPMVQLVLPSELQDHVTRKGKVLQVGNRTQKKTQGKAMGKGKSAPKKIDPTTLRVETGIFSCGEGIPLAQVELSQIGPAVSGIVLCNVQAALPFLKTGRPMSAGGLALIIVDDPEVAFPPAVSVEHVSLPVICTANSQPLLIDGRMVQLGTQQVVRKPQAEKYELISIASCVVKVMVFRDQAPGDWSQVVAHPLKYIFSKLPMLQPCQTEGCAQDCEAWHKAEACQVDDPILEVWNRQWLSLGFHPSQPDASELYVVHFRIPHCLQVQVQSFSGVDGVYCEPKDVDVKSPSTAFHVVWLPRLQYVGA